MGLVEVEIVFLDEYCEFVEELLDGKLIDFFQFLSETLKMVIESHMNRLFALVKVLGQVNEEEMN